MRFLWRLLLYTVLVVATGPVVAQEPPPDPPPEEPFEEEPDQVEEQFRKVNDALLQLEQLGVEDELLEQTDDE